MLGDLLFEGLAALVRGALDAVFGDDEADGGADDEDAGER